MQCLSVTLPHGCWHEGSFIGRVLVRPITGEDERFLAEWEEQMPRVVKETALLARLARTPDTHLSLARDAVRKLTCGDREALFLHLFHRLSGERLAATLRCPACGEKMMLDLAVPDLLVPPAALPEEEYVREVAGRRTVLRPVTGADLEAVCSTGEGAESLLRACVVSAEPPLPTEPLPADQLEVFSEALAALDPQADIVLDARCQCGNAVPVSLDAWEMLDQALARRQGRVDEEVHALAFYYHWTEEAILALPVHRRRRYLELIAGSLAEGQ